ncbi:unnamed protein product, partial [Durusdinium trenchii]
TDRARQVRVLILGTGPVAAQREFRCKDGVISTVSCDAFSRLYRQLAKETGFQPPHGFPEKLREVFCGVCIVMQYFVSWEAGRYIKAGFRTSDKTVGDRDVLRYCDVEELWQIFPKDYFHVVYVSNALDHTVHPLRSLKWLLWVLHPIGKLQLRHFRNVHPERWTALSDGQHQWGFDVDYGSGGEGSFLIWNHLHRWNVTEELEKDGARTLTHFQKPFVEVEVRKTSNFKGGLHT